MACRRCVHALSCGMVAVMDENINENERTIHESLLGVRGDVLFSVSDDSRLVPISEWTEPSLIVLRAMETACGSMAGGSYANGPLSCYQVAPILFVNYWGIDDEMNLRRSISTNPGVAREVGNLMAFAGGVLEAGATHEAAVQVPMHMCLRFPDNELVRKMARKKGSVAQAELDRRHEENHS